MPNYQAHLNFDENTQPIFVKSQSISYALKNKVDEEIERICTPGVITRTGQSEWGTTIVSVLELNGTIRLCANYKVTLNKVIKDEQYPIAGIEDIYGNKWRQTLLHSGY